MPDTKPTLLRTFHIDERLWKESIRPRFNEYVIVPGTPMIPARHPGTDDSPHPFLDMSLDHKELITLGESTTHTLRNQGRKVCPRVIFLTTPGAAEPGHGPHLLATYASKINAEKQYPLRLHIAAHGSPKSIGSINPDARFDPELFASLLCNVLSSAKIPQDQPITIVFHACNSAYCETDPAMSADEISRRVRQSSYIGQFAQAMKGEGFPNVTITGFRGFYSHDVRHQYSVVSSALTSIGSLKSEKAQFTVNPDGTVVLPQKTGLFFPVSLPIRDIAAPSSPTSATLTEPSTASSSDDEALSSGDEELHKILEAARILHIRRMQELRRLSLASRPVTPSGTAEEADVGSDDEQEVTAFNYGHT